MVSTTSSGQEPSVASRPDEHTPLLLPPEDSLDSTVEITSLVDEAYDEERLDNGETDQRTSKSTNLVVLVLIVGK